jgi:hypothetical protein
MGNNLCTRDERRTACVVQTGTEHIIKNIMEIMNMISILLDIATSYILKLIVLELGRRQ